MGYGVQIGVCATWFHHININITSNNVNGGNGIIASVLLYIESGIFYVRDPSFTLIDSTAVSVGDTIRIVMEIGKVEIFVNGVSSAEWVDASITYDYAYSSILGNKGFTVQMSNK